METGSAIGQSPPEPSGEEIWQVQSRTGRWYQEACGQEKQRSVGCCAIQSALPGVWIGGGDDGARGMG